MKFTNSIEVESAFYAAFQERDIELMAKVWESSEQICCIHPGSQRLFGVESVMHSWQQIFSVKNDMTIAISGQIYIPQEALVIHYVQENITVQNEYMGVVCATNIYRESEAGWRMILHHGNALLAQETAPKQFH